MSILRSVFFGFAAAIFAVGCGAGIASSAEDDAQAEEPAVVETVTTRGTSPDPSHVDIASAATPTCTVPELASNNVWTRASALVPGVACGTLATAAEEDWFSVVYGPGQVTLTLDAKDDALLSVGQAVGTTCVPSLANLHSLTASSTTATHLCVRIASPAKRVQSYVLFRK